jgi:isoleucyl-tRNA synthetase
MTSTPENLPDLETRVLARWAKDDTFARSLARRQDAPRWVFYEGPPTANGHPGVHHLLLRTFKDVFARHRTMAGYRVDRRAGWDCHGLPVELETQRTLGLRSKADVLAYGVQAFNDACREDVTRYTDEWVALTDRLGLWLDTDNAYRTLDDDYVESVWWSLRQVFDRGLLYRAERVVPHCPSCQTTLSSHELAQGYEDVPQTAAYVAFELTGCDEALLVWTTTPWTLPANLALAVSSDLQYARVSHEGRTLLLAADRVNAVLGAGATVLGLFSGAELVGRSYRPPFEMTDAPEGAYVVAAADFVQAGTGTGVVHVAPAHGEDDFALGQQLGLAPRSPVGLDGRYATGPWAGQSTADAEPALLSDLRDRGLLVGEEQMMHRYPHCWRCRTPLMYAAKPTWYAQTTKVAERMLELNSQVGWHPEHTGTGRFGAWLKGNVDWALSRERFWGTPLPLWVCDDGHVHCVGSRAELAQLTGAAQQDLHRPTVDELQFPCTQCAKTMRRTPEVLDGWWDSGAMPFAQHGAPFRNAEKFAEQFPAAFVCEGLDQTRGWFYSLLAVSTLVFDAAPYENVLCLGMVADADGKKMSKSRGNAVDPWQLFDTYGADACRWYYLTAKPPWEGYAFAETDVREAASRLMTLWHVARFWRTHHDGSGQPQHTLAEVTLTDLDRWLLSRLDATTQTAADALDAYDATTAARAVDAFVDELSNWYLRLSRGRVWAGDPAALTTLRHVLMVVAQLAGPLVPFLADEVHALTGQPDSVHLTDYPLPAGRRDEPLEAAMSTVRELARLGRSVRAQVKLALRQPLAEATVLLGAEDDPAVFMALSGLLAAELNVKVVTLARSSADVADLHLKLNFPRVGPRLGAQTKAVAAAVDAGGADMAQRFVTDGELTVTVGAQDDVALDGEDVEVRMLPRAGHCLATEGARAVALLTDLDDALRDEGWARDVCHAVQLRRRDLDLHVSDRVRVTLSGDAVLLTAVRAHVDWVASETLAVEVLVDAGTRVPAAQRLAVAGRELWLTVQAA